VEAVYVGVGDKNGSPSGAVGKFYLNPYFLSVIVGAEFLIGFCG
jgi:hypothetical protein